MIPRRESGFYSRYCHGACPERIFITLDFQITLMGITGTNKVSRLDLEGILSFGERNGLGQWRNAGFGAFEVIHFEEIDEADAHDISEHGGGVVSA